MPKAEPVFYWEANTQLKVRNIAFSLQAHSVKRGSIKVNVFDADWLEDGQVMWNPAARLKGWLKAQGGLLRPGYAEQIAGSIKVYPADGATDSIAIAKPKELVGSKTPPAPEGEFELPEGLPYPNKRFITVKADRGKSRSTTIYWFTLPKAIEINLKIVSFARSFSPEIIEGMMRKLGDKVGLGDKYSSGQYGLFTVEKFETSPKERIDI